MSKSNFPLKEKYIESPEKLWEFFIEYINNEKDNPMSKREYVGKEGDEKDTPLMTPITFEGFECYLADINVIQDLKDYSSNKEDRYTIYAPIIARIRQNCFVQNFKGAAVGLFNSNLIARKLGLVESSKNETNTTFTVEIKED